MGYGIAGYFGMRRASTWGSGAAATTFVEIMNENIKVDIERFDYKNVIGSLVEPEDSSGVSRVSGNVVFGANPANIGNFLTSLFNGSTITSISATYWKHVYTQPTNSSSGFSTTCPTVPYDLEVFRDVTSANLYAGGVVTDFAMSFAPNQDVRCTANFIARGSSLIVKQTPTFPSSPTAPFKFNQVSLQLAGAATAAIESLNVKVMNPMEGIHVLNQSTDIAKIRRTGPQKVELDGTLEFSDTTEYLNFISQTEQAMIINAFTAASFSMLITIPRIVYTAFPLGTAGRGRNLVSFTAKGLYHSGSGTAINIQLFTVNSYF